MYDLAVRRQLNGESRSEKTRRANAEVTTGKIGRVCVFAYARTHAYTDTFITTRRGLKRETHCALKWGASRARSSSLLFSLSFSSFRDVSPWSPRKVQRGGRDKGGNSYVYHRSGSPFSRENFGSISGQCRETASGKLHSARPLSKLQSEEKNETRKLSSFAD